MPSTQGIKAGRAYVELGIGDKLSAGLKRAQMRMRAFAAGVTQSFLAISGRTGKNGVRS